MDSFPELAKRDETCPFCHREPFLIDQILQPHEINRAHKIASESRPNNALLSRPSRYPHYFYILGFILASAFGRNDSKLDKTLQNNEKVLSILEILVHFVKRLVKELCGISVTLLILLDLSCI
jgi:hypothetical protein